MVLHLPCCFNWLQDSKNTVSGVVQWLNAHNPDILQSGQPVQTSKGSHSETDTSSYTHKKDSDVRHIGLISLKECWLQSVILSSSLTFQSLRVT